MPFDNQFDGYCFSYYRTSTKTGRYQISKLDTDFRDQNLVSCFRRRYNYFNIKGISDAYN